MKIGDLVQMKKRMFWTLKGDPYMDYTEEPLLVVEHAYQAMKVLFPGGRVANCWSEDYEVISEDR
jgi:hypothetical protein